MKRTVLSNNYLPARPPTLLTLTLVLALDHWRAPGWAWGVALTVLALVWAAFVYDRLNQQRVNLRGEPESGRG